MYKKLNNKEWEEDITLYYKENKDISMKASVKEMKKKTYFN